MATFRTRVSGWLGEDAANEPNALPRGVVAVAIAAAVAVAFPAVVWAADSFTDVPAGNVHHDAVSAIAAAGVTEGCTPQEYCPERAVRRDQMASFMDRLGALSGQEPVVNAATAQTAQTAQTVEGFDAVLARLDELETDNAALTGRVEELEIDNAALTGRVEDLESGETGGDAALAERVGAVEDTLDGVTREDREIGIGGDVHDTLVFEGMNLQLVNGEDTTEAANGVGNLIVGYNAGAGERGGSHNVVIGDHHQWTHWGGFVAGTNNAILNTWTSVLGSRDNIASGEDATVSGGYTNVASGRQSSVSGGHLNVATGFQASISGGLENTASGIRASVSGGEQNLASGPRASVSGGQSNTASGGASSILGGFNQTVDALFEHYPN